MSPPRPESPGDFLPHGCQSVVWLLLVDYDSRSLRRVSTWRIVEAEASDTTLRVGNWEIGVLLILRVVAVGFLSLSGPVSVLPPPSPNGQNIRPRGRPAAHTTRARSKFSGDGGVNSWIAPGGLKPRPVGNKNGARCGK